VLPGIGTVSAPDAPLKLADANVFVLGHGASFAVRASDASQ
jgi:hypothetical protein